MYRKLFKLHLYDTLDFCCKFYRIFCFIIPLIVIIFKVFYQVDCEQEASSIANFSIYVFLSSTGRWSNGMTITCHRKIEVWEFT